jgi:oligopeptide/dipeptide ABC transporter ATP-binding protein
MTQALVLEQIVKRFPGPKRGTFVHAVNGVSLNVGLGETVALVGESGSGKTTLGRIALRLEKPTQGQIEVGGLDITALSIRALRRMRPRMQMVFQDPWATLNPRMSVAHILEEPLALHTAMPAQARKQAVEQMASRVRLGEQMLHRYPAQLSGGQLQRVALARALITEPKLVVLDEPTSSLDLSVRAEILHLLQALRLEMGAAFLFITHDLATVRLIADRIVVLYLGSVMESGPASDVFSAPLHPYTQALFSAQLRTRPEDRLRRHVLSGEIPSPVNMPPGCPFAGRCPLAIDACRDVKPVLETWRQTEVACIRVRTGDNQITETARSTAPLKAPSLLPSKGKEHQ